MQSSSPPLESLPYVVLRGARSTPTYKRRIPPALRAAVGSSTITARLAGHPFGTVGERQQFLAAYSRTHQQAEQRLAAGRSRQQELRDLTAIEQLGVAGVWAKQAGQQGADTVIVEEAAAILQALCRLELVLPAAVPADWRAHGASEHAQLQEAVQELARALHFLEHPGRAPMPHGHLAWEDGFADVVPLVNYLEACVVAAAPQLREWLRRAQRQLERLGLAVTPLQRQQVALRMARIAAAMGRQEAAIEAGQSVQPLTFPEPPQAAVLLRHALSQWESLRNPAPKTVFDTERRLAELQSFLGHDRLDQLTPEQVSNWRAQLIERSSTATVKRKLALVRAVLQAAAADGLPIDPQAIERLSGKGLRESGGTRRQRRPFSQEEASLLWSLSRQQNGPRPFDRWAFPLGLSLGCRLEELVGLSRGDVRQIDGVWVVEIQPTEDRRLKNDSSVRRVPIPTALEQEGFVTWAQRQDAGLLFPEPEPPAADPRRSHYASVRLSKIIRRQAGIDDPAAVFHSCRHTAAQSLVDAGAEQRVIEQILGHTSRSMTARYSRGGVPLAQLLAAMESRDWNWVPQLTSST
ncbi:MAG: tyrosine-type recombinase/integrase [Cyanobacteriota bacterium]|nr:tyrosine-type recombinase/integrase [Cyanobacteriota bacterium]